MTFPRELSSDPIFALAPELKLRVSKDDGMLLTNSREVARVFFHNNHRRVVRKIMEDIWHAPMRPIFQNSFRPQADGSIDLTSDGLSLALGGWGFRNKRVVEFNSKWAKLVHEIAACFEAETGVNPLRDGIKKFFPGVRWQFLTRDGRRCCDDCKLPKLAGQYCTTSCGPHSQSRTHSYALIAPRSGSDARSRKQT